MNINNAPESSSNARQVFASAADFKAACKAAKKIEPGTWAQLAAALIESGHGDALNDVIPLLATDRGRKLVRPNNAREVEKMTENLSRLRSES